MEIYTEAEKQKSRARVSSEAETRNLDLGIKGRKDSSDRLPKMRCREGDGSRN